MTHTRERAPHHKGRIKPPQFSAEDIAAWRVRLRGGLKAKELAIELGIANSRLSEILSGDAYDIR